MIKPFVLLAVISNVAFSSAILSNSSQVKAVEKESLICTLGSFSTNNFYSQGEDSAAKIYQEENGNQFIRLSYDSAKKFTYSSFYFVNSETFAEKGSYVLKFDYRISDSFTTNNIFCSIFESEKSSRSETTTIASSKEVLESCSEPIIGSTWKRASFSLILEKAKSRDYNVLKIGFNTMSKSNNFLDIDNIQLCKDEDITFNETINVTEYISTGVKSLCDFQDVKSSFESPSNSFSVLGDETGNHFGKLNAINGKSSVKIYAANYMSENKRTFEFKVKKGPNFNGTLCLYSTASSTNPTFDLSTVGNEWAIISDKYNVKDKTSDYLSLEFTSSNNDPDNYLLIDDMYAIYNSDRNLINDAGDFESLEQNLPSGTSWYYDDRLFMKTPNTKIIYEGIDNKVLKVYEDAVSTNFTVKVNPNIYKTGWYEMKFKVKGGSEFYTNNIGYRLYGSTASFTNAAITGDQVVMQDNDYMSFVNEWGEITTQFHINANEPAFYVGVNFWVFFHNDQAQYKSVNNYCLFDDIRIYEQNPVTGELGPNLIDENNSNIANFRVDQGVQNMGFLTLDGYDYTQTIIDEKCLEQFNEGYSMAICSKYQNYWGTVSYDVPAKIVKEDGYHASMLTYDGLNITKTYSSMTYLFNEKELKTKKRYLFEFDYKLQVSTTKPTNVARVAFTGAKNLDDFMIDLLDKTPGTYSTLGVNRYLYDYTISANDSGWNHVRLTFAPDYDFKMRVNSIRFLIDAKFDTNNKLFFSNIKLMEHSDVKYDDITPVVHVTDNNNLVWILVGSIGGGVLLAGGAVAAIILIKKKKGRIQNEK